MEATDMSRSNRFSDQQMLCLSPMPFSQPSFHHEVSELMGCTNEVERSGVTAAAMISLKHADKNKWEMGCNE